jgi:Uncharacterized protein conserved in bacteria (DUF2169)
METLFPTTTGYEGFFLVGFRKTDGALTQRTGTAVLKRTYDVDPAAGVLTPSPDALPVFLQDAPDNVVENSDFSGVTNGAPTAWQGESATVAVGSGHGVAGDALKVTGTASGRVVQTLTFDEPLGGRQFVLSFSAKSSPVGSAIQNVQLEADGSTPICVINANVTTAMTRFSASGVWPATVQAKEMRLVLRMAATTAVTVYYDRVQVEERNHLTRWDAKTMLRYEHDLVPFKLQGDVVVLGFSDIAGVSRVKVDNTTWFEVTLSLNEGRAKALCGWEPRGVSPRPAGSFSSDPSHYPPQWPVTDPARDPLPADFDNRFYNGYSRQAARLPAIPYLPRGAEIRIERGAGNLYRFRLGNETVSATVCSHGGSGPDEETTWSRTVVTMHLDTLVIEPERNRCYAVWRGAWSFDETPEDGYRRLVVEASA